MDEDVSLDRESLPCDISFEDACFLLSLLSDEQKRILIHYFEPDNHIKDLT